MVSVHHKVKFISHNRNLFVVTFLQKRECKYKIPGWESHLPVQECIGSPILPGGHAHLKLPGILLQRALRPQGSRAHSLASAHPESRGSPSKPGGQAQWWPPGTLVQIAPGAQAPSYAHSSTSAHCHRLSLVTLL